MRRTLAVVGFSWLLTLVAAAFLGFTAAIVFLVMTAAGAVAAFLVPALRKGRVIPAALLACTLALASFCLTEQFSYAPIVRLDGQTASVTGYITDLPGIHHRRAVPVHSANHLGRSARCTPEFQGHLHQRLFAQRRALRRILWGRDLFEALQSHGS